jgi:tape measure domain-containing protein
MAAITVAELQAILTLRDSLSPALKQVEANVQGSAVSFGFLERIGQRAFDALLVGARAVVSGIVGLAGAAIQAAGDFEQTNIAFTTMLGSGEDAAKFLKELQDFAAATPFEFPDLVQASQKLLAMGFAAKNVIPIMTAIGDAAAGLGGGAAMIDRLTLAIGQMQAKGKVAGGEMRQLAEAGIPAWKFLADAIGVSIPEAMKLVEKGAVSSATGITAILKGMGTNFEGLMEQQSQTLLGKWSTLKDNVGFIMRDLGAALIPAANAMVDVTAPFLELLRDLAKVAAENKDGLAALAREGLGLLSAGLQTALVGIGAVNEGFLKARLVYIDIIGWLTKMAFSFEFLQKVKEHPLQLAGAWEELKIKVQATDIVTNQMKASAEGQAGAIAGLVDKVGSANVKFAELAAGTRILGHETRTQTGDFDLLGGAAVEASEAIAKLAAETKKLLATEAAQSYEDMAKELKALGEEGAAEAAESLEAMVKEAKALKEAGLAQLGDEAAKSFEGMASELKDLGPALTLFEEVSKAIGGAVQITDALESAFAQMGISADHGIGQAVKGFGDLAHAAQDGAKSFAAFSSGDILGGITNGLKALGGVISGVKNIWNGLFGKGEIMKVNDMRDAFFAAHGGFAAFGAEMAKVSGEDWAGKIFKATTVEQFNALVKEAQGLLDTQGQAQEALNAAVEKYGFTIDELGPKWAQQELDTKAGELLKDYELLKASGIDVNTIIERMGPNLNEYVQSAIKAGSTIPEAMRPVIEKMIQNGELLDENGKAYESVEAAGLSFSKTLSEGMAEVVEQIKALVAALTGIPQSVSPIHVPVVYDDPGYDGRPGPEEHAAAAGFSGMVYGPTRFLVGESGPEHVQVTPAGKGGPGPSNADVVSAINGMRSDLRNLPYVLAKATTAAWAKA